MVQSYTNRDVQYTTGKVIQTVCDVFTGSLTISDLAPYNIPGDGTIPQSNEGVEILSQAITPTNANNNLVVVITAGAGGGQSITKILALFKDSETDARVCSAVKQNSSDYGLMTLVYEMTAGTTSEITFKARMGPIPFPGSRTYPEYFIYVNSGIGGQPENDLGGIIPSSMMIFEVAP